MLWIAYFFLYSQKGKLCTQTNTYVLDYTFRLFVTSLWSPCGLFMTTTVYFSVLDIVRKNFFLHSVLEFGCCMNVYVETSCPYGSCLGHNKDCCFHLIVYKRTVELILLKAVGLLPQNDPRITAIFCVHMDVLCFKPKCTLTRIRLIIYRPLKLLNFGRSSILRLLTIVMYRDLLLKLGMMITLSLFRSPTTMTLDCRIRLLSICKKLVYLRKTQFQRFQELVSWTRSLHKIVMLAQTG